MNVCPHFVLFCLIWIKFRTGDVHINLLCDVCFMKTSTMNDLLCMGE